MSNSQVDELFEFLQTPTAWHATDWLKKQLISQNYIQLKEGDSWQLEPGKNYFTIRNGSSLCAFKLPLKDPTSISVLGAHTDSPGLKLKPNSEYLVQNMIMLGVEVYGGPLLNAWVDRELGIAGRVTCSKDGAVYSQLVNMSKNPCIIPQLAIHLNPEVNKKGLVLNKQDHLSALAGLHNKEEKETHYLQKTIRRAVSGL